MIHVGDGATPDGMLAYEDLLAAATPISDVRRGGDSLAGLFYTGGTTGFSKGVMLSHANLMTSAMGCTATGEFVSAGGTYLHAAPMFHAADQAGGFGAALVGATHVIVPGFDPKVVLDAISVHGVTDTLLVPTMIQILVDHPDLSQYDLSSWRNLAYGGSAIAEAVLERTKKNLPNVRLMQAYGMTELSPVTTLLRFEDHTGARIRSAGRAAPHSEVRILDADDEEVPRGTVGEICSYGGHVMLGYWNKPEETAAAIRNGWMHSGDGGYMDDDGFVYVVDRIKDMIVTGGENVYSAEVEQAVALHPAVAACAVIGIPSDEWGESVHAVVVLAPRRDGHARGAAGALQGADRRLQGASLGGVRRRPARERCRQGAEARPACTLLGGHRPQRRLSLLADSPGHVSPDRSVGTNGPGDVGRRRRRLVGVIVDGGLELLTEQEACTLLAGGEVGRIGITLGAMPAIFPVNYRLVDGAIVFLTAPGSKLSAAASGAVVAFEVDDYGALDRSGWSVLAIGQAEVVEDADVVDRVMATGLQPFAGGTRTAIVRIDPTFVSGRRLVHGARRRGLSTRASPPRGVDRARRGLDRPGVRSVSGRRRPGARRAATAPGRPAGGADRASSCAPRRRRRRSARRARGGTRGRAPCRR